MTVYLAAEGLTFTRDSLERALNSHRDAGLIREWKRHVPGLTAPPRGWVRKATPLWHVTLEDGTPLVLATPWELHAFVAGLATARVVMERAR